MKKFYEILGRLTLIVLAQISFAHIALWILENGITVYR